MLRHRRDGLTVGLELSFQYRLQQSADSLAELYMMFGLEYESAFRREARDVLRNAASGFTAFECWRNRTALVVSMQAELDTALSRWRWAVWLRRGEKKQFGGVTSRA